MGRSTTKVATSNNFNPALIAIGDLFNDAFDSLDSYAGRVGIQAHYDIKNGSIANKSAVFYQHYIPLRQQMTALLAETYRRFYKLALANPSQTRNQPEHWAWTQLQPAIHAALGWIREWYRLACECENQTIRFSSSTPVLQSGTISLPFPTSAPQLLPWRAPSWLFGISLALFGVGPLKQKHVPKTDSEERLNEAYTRLLLKGARRVFLWELQAVCDRVRSEEIAAAGAIATQINVTGTERAKAQDTSQVYRKGFEGLGPKKTDLSQYSTGLTEKQQLAFSLKYEYGLGLAEIARRMGVDRKTAFGHVKAAEKRIGQVRSGEKSKAQRAKRPD